MLLSKTVNVKWNAKIKKHYVDLGYEFTKMGDSFEVKVNDLTDGSAVRVCVKCDYCGCIYNVRWYWYLRRKQDTIVHKDCCKECCEIKASESIVEKYGGYSELFITNKEKRDRTNLKLYGVKNVFSSKEIQKRIRETNLVKYGVSCSALADSSIEKRKRTCLKKYGVEHYVELFKGKYIKENSPNWKGGVEHSRVERATYEYQQWRKAVFGRDLYTCQNCGDRSGNGHAVELHAHHIKNWKDNECDRYDVSNGITLCHNCHMKFHSIYGKQNNTQAQLDNFLNR